ncbi:MAG: 2-oxo-4-hydroxy-4-carboxy-5-ureidoimidazoline decarboxylase, partial [Chloroflexota bacterium]
TLSWLNQAAQPQFVAAIGFIFEGSPHFVARAWDLRPFPSVEHLYAALWAEVDQTSGSEQMALIRAHPDLAGKAAIAGDLTEDSRREQSSAGLDRLTPEQFAAFTRLNTAYRERFGFPFIVCVREHTRESILTSFATRLAHEPGIERGAALAEIGKIARLRLFGVVRASEEEGSV